MTNPIETPAQWGLVMPATRPPIPGGLPQTAAGVLDPWLDDDPDAAALIGRHGRYTVAELDRETDCAAAALHELGVRAGDRIAASLPNDTALPIAFLAAQRLGAVWVGLNRILAPPEKAYILRDAGVRVLLVLEEEREPIAAALEELPGLEHVIGLRPGDETCPWSKRIAAQQPHPRGAVDPFAPAAIAYTSGTTGFPKGAVHSQHNLLLPGAIGAIQGRVPAGTRQGAVLALTILNLVILELLAPWLDRRACVCIDRLDPLGLAEWIREERVGTFSGVPTIFHDLLTHPDVKPADLVSLVAPGVGGSNTPPEVLALYRERFGREVRVGYGMTEAPTAVSWSDGSVPPEPGLCGVALPQVEIEIVGEGDHVLAPGEVGEICVRPARSGEYAGVYTPMLGYWNKPDATAEALRGGRYHTGDLGTFAADGNLYIRGRRSELILRGGANVYPAEVERVLEGHPSVGAAAVFGLPDARLGERVVAVVEAAPDADPSEEALREHLSGELARYKVPDRIAVTPGMPRNAMGKIVKRELHPLFDEHGVGT